MQFKFFIGSYTGASFDLELKKDILYCDESGLGYTPIPELSNFFPVKDSADFKAMVDYLGTRKLKEEYANETILDGTH